jgi:hypothetical protein
MMTISRTIGMFFLFLVVLPLTAETWFVRADGGTRYSARVQAGQCDGRADAPYPGKGVDQHCAFNDVRYLWADNSGNPNSWVIAGGDTVVIRGCTGLVSQTNPSNPNCRLGYDNPTSGNAPNYWCGYGNPNTSCFNPPIPSGTAARHTKILGGCAYGGYTCTPINNQYPYGQTNETQLFGGFGLTWTFNLESTSYVDLEGIELTTHNGVCTSFGAPSYPRGCSSGTPYDDFAQNGFLTNATTSNVVFQDVYVHGFNASGLDGPIGGPITMTRMFVGFNAFAGWNFDDGSSTADAPGSSITANQVTMIFNGCYEQYPIRAKYPAQACYDTNSQGFGDSWSGQDTKLESFICDHCVMAYNTKDGFIGPHTLTHYLKITNSESYGNMGQQWKWGTPPDSTTIFENNLTVGNCHRMADTLPGAPPSYNQHLGGFCRAAGDIFSFFVAANSTVLFADNTAVGYSATMFDLNCQTPNACGSTHFVFRNNIILGLLNPNISTGEVPGLFYYGDSSVKLAFDHDLFFNLRSKPCPSVGSSVLICASPEFVNQPSSTLTSESQLDNFDFHLRGGGPAIGHGISVDGVTTDYFGMKRPDPPSIGAVEPTNASAVEPRKDSAVESETGTAVSQSNQEPVNTERSSPTSRVLKSIGVAVLFTGILGGVRYVRKSETKT